jgi:hypothetical protein
MIILKSRKKCPKSHKTPILNDKEGFVLLISADP